MTALRRTSLFVCAVAVLGAVASAVVQAMAGNWDGAVRFAVVTAVLLLTYRAKVPTVFVAAFSVFALLATWAAVQHWYRGIAHFDTLVHVVAPGSLAAVAYFLLADAGLLPDVRDRTLPGRAWAPVPWVLLTGTTAAVVWEFYEWIVEQISPQGMIVGYTDTVLDLLAGMCGSLVAGVLVLQWRRRHVAS